MNQPKNITIALLCVSAVILAMMLILANVRTVQAETSIAGGNYIMVTGAYTENLELLYIIDRSQRKLNVYVLNISKGDLILRDSANLKLAFQRRR